MRGESERVAERVRGMLRAHGVEPPQPEPAAPASRWTDRLPMRIDPGRRGVVAVGAAVVLVAALTLAWVLAARPHAMGVASTGPSSTAPWPTGVSTSVAGRQPARASSSAAVVVVDVAGKVRRPGIYRLPPTARVDDAVRAAGGALRGASLDRLNLAAKVSDGEQIAVGIAPAPDAGTVPGGASGGGGTAGSSTPVNLNSATLEQLQTLPGVGPVLAQHVIDWRTAHGSFRSVQQLNDVPGIGDVKFAALKDLVTA